MAYPKEDTRPPRGGWANGPYHCKCNECGDFFIGDKRAFYCADCAYGPLPVNSREQMTGEK